MLLGLTPYKIILSLFFIFAWTRVVGRYIRNVATLTSLVAWTLIWGVGLFLVYVPSKADIASRLLGASNGFNAVASIAIILLFYSVYRIYAKIEELGHELNKLNQASSIAHATAEGELKKLSRRRTQSRKAD